MIGLEKCSFQVTQCRKDVISTRAQLIVYTKQLLNSDWLKKQCSFPVTVQKRETSMQSCNTVQLQMYFILV